LWRRSFDSMYTMVYNDLDTSVVFFCIIVRDP
jgi:hypothetical protein